MKCTEAISLFNPYLDGSLTGSQMHHLADHFKSCRSCKTEYAALRQTQSLLAGLGHQPAPHFAHAFQGGAGIFQVAAFGKLLPQLPAHPHGCVYAPSAVGIDP